MLGRNQIERRLLGRVRQVSYERHIVCSFDLCSCTSNTLAAAVRGTESFCLHALRDSRSINLFATLLHIFRIDASPSRTAIVEYPRRRLSMILSGMRRSSSDRPSTIRCNIGVAPPFVNLSSRTRCVFVHRRGEKRWIGYTDENARRTRGWESRLGGSQTRGRYLNARSYTASIPCWIFSSCYQTVLQ